MRARGPHRGRCANDQDAARAPGHACFEHAHARVCAGRGAHDLLMAWTFCRVSGQASAPFLPAMLEEPLIAPPRTPLLRASTGARLQVLCNSLGSTNF